TVGTLNRVMIVELSMSAGLVAVMVALPLLFAPFRALVGFRSDNHRSALGWRRVPYIWLGTLAQFGGFAFMPFALLLQTGDTDIQYTVGTASAALAFLLVGIGYHTTQTAGLALATDLAPEEARPRVVALMFVMLLVGLVASGAAFSLLLSDFSNMRLVQVVQGAAVMTLVLNMAALWKQEARNPGRLAAMPDAPPFMDVWRRFTAESRARRFLVAVGLGAAAFGMQDVVLEPYGAEVLGLSVGATAALTALMAAGALVAFALAAAALVRGHDAARLAAMGLLVGIVGFAAITLAAPFQSAALFRAGVFVVGFGGGLFSVSTLTAAMSLDRLGTGINAGHGLALGAWGAVQATGAGLAIAAGGLIRDFVSGIAATGAFGPTFTGPILGYSVVYHIEILLLFVALAAIGPLAGHRIATTNRPKSFGLSQFPG
ncbi:MAG: MFS transporter, partial [Beijerinckiaceae bacterium]